MPFDPGLAERLQQVMTRHFAQISGLTETRMMGGFGYLLNGNMCAGIHKDSLIIRIGQSCADEIILRAHVRPMDFTGRIMKVWATVEAEAISEDSELESYCQLALDFVSQLPAK